MTRVTKDEEEEDHNDSQFFNMASKALKKLKRRTSMNETSSANPQPAQLQQKIFKSPKAAKPLQILVSIIFALLCLWGYSLVVKLGEWMWLSLLKGTFFQMKIVFQIKLKFHSWMVFFVIL